MFAQHSKLIAREGARDRVVEKFLEAATIQEANPACVLMVVSTSTDERDSVYLTEVWTSEDEHERARQSDEIAAWAAEMPELVERPAESQRLELVGGKGL